MAMQKTDFQSQPLGTCQRLFNFIMNSLTARSLRRETLGQNPTSDEANRISPPTRGQTPLNSPIDFHDKAIEASSFLEQDREMLEKEDPDADVIVEFRRKKGMEQWKQVDNFDPSSSNTDKARHKSEDQEQKQGDNMQNRLQHPVEGSKHIDVGRRWGGGKRGRRKNSIIKVEADERERNKMKDNIIRTENVNLESAQDDHKMAPVIHIRPHLIFSESNINEKSTEFIENKKAALKRMDTTS